MAIFILFAVTLGFVFFTLNHALKQQQQETVRAQMDGLTEAYQRGNPAEVTFAIRHRLRTEPDSVYLLVDDHGRKLAGNLPEWPADLPVTRTWQKRDMVISDSPTAQPIDILSVQFPDHFRLLAGHRENAGAAITQTLVQSIAIASLAGFFLILSGSLAIARYMDRRVDHVARIADKIMAGKLTERLPGDVTGDAFEHLNAILNQMLERIEHLMTEMRMVTDSLAHDLRSPLTRLKSGLEQSLLPGQNPDARDRSIENAIVEADKLLLTIVRLLDVSRMEAGLGREQMTELDVAELLRNISELYEPVAEEKGFQLLIAGSSSAKIPGHPDLLSQAVTNLLDNALKYAKGGTISLAAERVGDRVDISVCDDGPGIAEEERALAVSRFGRLDPARSSDGTGLGLHLIAAIARLHGGELQLADNAPGLAAHILLPASV